MSYKVECDLYRYTQEVFNLILVHCNTKLCVRIPPKSLKDEKSLYQQGEGVKPYKAMMQCLQHGNIVAFFKACEIS